jgi:competence protein ComEA
MEAVAVPLPGKNTSDVTEINGADIPGASTGVTGNETAAGSEPTGGATVGGETSGGAAVSGGAETIKPPELAGAPIDGDGKININLASQSELMDLPGIGSVLASRIVDYRRQHGGFSRIEDLRNVSGIGEKRYEAIQSQITVG